MCRAGTSTSFAQVQHSGYEDSWAPAKRSNASFLAQSGTLDGLAGFDRGLVLDLNPVVTRKATGAPSPNGWGYTHPRPQLGGNVRWGMTNNLTLNGTVNPDFAEVESDAGQFVIDPRQALFFPEKRPFFLEGLEQFNVAAQPDLHASHREAGRRDQAHGQGRRHERRVSLGERRSSRCRPTATYDDVLQHPARAARRRRPVADRHGVHRSRRRRRLQPRRRRRRPHRVRRRVQRVVPVRAELRQDARRGDERAALGRHSRAQRQAVRFSLHDDRHRREVPHAERIHLAPGHRARRARSSRDLVQRARQACSRR